MPRILFAASPTGSATAASQDKFAIAQPGVQVLLTAGTLKTLTNLTFVNLMRFPDKDNQLFMVYRDNTTIRAYFACTSQGFSGVIATMSTTGLADSDLVVIGIRHVSGTTSPAPDLYATFTKVSDGSSLGSGSVRLGGTMSTAASSIEVWNHAHAGELAGLAVFDGAPASTYLSPVSDPALIAFYRFAQGDGATSDTVSGGTALSVTNATFSTTADPWDAAAPAAGRPAGFNRGLLR